MGCIPENSEGRCEENGPSRQEGRFETEGTESRSQGPGGFDAGWIGPGDYIIAETFTTRFAEP
jgi:hypothetical protein